MATSRSKRSGTTGTKIGRPITYQLGHLTVTRTVGEITTPPSEAQLNVRLKIKLSSKFLSPFLDFISIGFALEGLRTRTSAQNQALKQLYKNSFQGTYPHICIDHSQVQLTCGTLPPLINPVMALSENGVRCTWNGELEEEGARWNDQVIILAYCPELEVVEYNCAAAQRHVGEAELSLYVIPKGYFVETYVSVISNQRKDIANSTYTGRLFR